MKEPRSLKVIALLSISFTDWIALSDTQKYSIYPEITGLIRFQKIHRQILFIRRQNMEFINTLIAILDDKGLIPKKSVSFPDRASYKLAEGDHILVYHADDKIIHHGIIVGHGQVVDFWGETKSSAKLSIRELSNFLEGYSEYHVVPYEKTDGTSMGKKEEKKARKCAVNIALTLVKDNILFQKYNAINSNYECFAWFCKTGGKKYTSDQAQKVMDAFQRDIYSKDSKVVTALEQVSAIVNSIS